MTDSEPEVDPDDEVLVLHNARTEKRTRLLFGRLYHYGVNARGHLVLLPGPDPREML